MNSFKIICENCGEECQVQGMFQVGIQGTSLIELNLNVEIKSGEPTDEFGTNYQRCGNTIYLNL